MTDSYVPKTFFSFIDCGAECPHCLPKLAQRFGQHDPEWFVKTTCIRKLGYPEAHRCYKCQKDWFV